MTILSTRARAVRAALFSISLLLCPRALAQEHGADSDALHARALEELRARDPAAADAFDRARSAGDRYEHEEAARYYAEAQRLAPDVSHGYRMHSQVIMQREGDAAQAIRLGRRAVELDGSAINLADLALLLARQPSSKRADLDEAERLADEAVAVGPEEPWGYEARLAIAASTARDAEARQAAADLERVGDPQGAAYGLAAGAMFALYRDPTASAAPALARDLAERASVLAPDDVDVLSARAYVALYDDDLPTALLAARRAVEVAPNASGAHYTLANAYLMDADWDAAEGALEEARRCGLDDARYEDLSSRIAFARWLIWIALAVVFGVPLGAYFGTMLLLFLAGWVLSRLTLRAAARLPRERSGRAVGMAGGLRWTYRVVLWLSCAFYYASLPLIAVVVLLLVAAVFLAALAMGAVPIKLILLLAFFAIMTIGSMVDSLFARRRDGDPGVKLDVAAHPRFAAALSEVAGRVGTRTVDSVFLTAGTEVAVTERGGIFLQLRRRTERCLILGVGVLDGMSVQELKAVLAHEHGHLRNEDTAGGSFALAVRSSLHLMALGLVKGGLASRINPAWWFTIVFSKVFTRISHGASRLQEVLADRWAAYAYGSEAFARGLRHVVSASVRFDARADVALQEVAESGAPLVNFYRHEPSAVVPDVDDAIEAELMREPSAYDSHPATRDRIAWVTALAATGDGPTDPSEAWTLFEDREALERLMTGEIRDRVAARYGVWIPELAEAA